MRYLYLLALLAIAGCNDNPKKMQAIAQCKIEYVDKHYEPSQMLETEYIPTCMEARGFKYVGRLAICRDGHSFDRAEEPTCYASEAELRLDALKKM